jgi:hypothetical protein
MRAVQSMPGVSTLSDFSRDSTSAGADQNLILLDDMDGYNPSHSSGFFSTFNVGRREDGRPAEVRIPGAVRGRLSSLLDVHNRDRDRKD